jgi:outer membrane lipoprotein SlyB
MEASNTINTRSALHPLLTLAAVSLTVFSAVGVATLTGLLPVTHSTTKATEPAAVSAPLAPPAARAAPEAQIAPVMPAASAASPMAKPKPRKVAAAAAPAQAPAQPAVYRDFETGSAAQEPARQGVAQAPAPVAAPAPVEAPKPVAVAGVLGRIESIREVEQAGQHTALGPIAGGIAGAVIGHQFGNGLGNKIMTVAGAAGGAIAGREIEKRARGTKTWETTVRLDDGTTRVIPSNVAPFWHEGERIRFVDGRLQPV